jgi:hypothetical protein
MTALTRYQACVELVNSRAKDDGQNVLRVTRVIKIEATKAVSDFAQHIQKYAMFVSRQVNWLC